MHIVQIYPWKEFEEKKHPLNARKFDQFPYGIIIFDFIFISLWFHRGVAIGV